MSILKLFKKIKNRFKANSYSINLVRNYNHNLELSLDEIRIVPPVNNEVLSAYNNLKVSIEAGNKKHKVIKAINKFDLLTNQIEEHNKNVREIEAFINEVDTLIEDAFSNPHNLVSYKIKYDELSKVIILFKDNFSANARKLLSYKDFFDNYNRICSEFDIKSNVDKIINNLEDDYFDENIVLSKIEIYKKITLGCEIPKYYEITSLNDFENILKAHNADFINNHLNDDIFNDVTGKSLEEDQRRAVLCNPLSNLVIAGAGAGKTLTIAGKVKYLLDVKHVNKDKILLLSYSNNSAKDLKKKIDLIAPDMNVHTFHALGLSVLNKVSNEKQTVEEQYDAIIESYFRDELKNNSKMLYKVLTYYGLYISSEKFDKQYDSKGDLYTDLKKEDLITLRDQLSLAKDGRSLETFKKEYVKSYEELAIANYYFINGINYTYEASYKETKTNTTQRRQYTPDFYLNEYGIYHEHYGINKDGRATQYSADEEKEYLDSMVWKRALHVANNTTCLETYSYEFADGTVFDKLEKKLREHNVEFHPLTNDQISDAIDSIYDGQSFKSLINLIKTFINLYKAQYIDEKSFDLLKKSSFLFEFQQIRANLFLDICKEIYCYYKKHLTDEGKIDFDDMILKSTNALDKLDDYKYDYIIVDEFQDISFSRMKFLKELIRHGNSKLFAVGDDWQAIYRFSGCDINIFIDFKEYFKDTVYNFINSTHRYSQELQDIAAPFIMKNDKQIKKNIKSNKHLEKPVKIIYYKDNKYDALMTIFSEITKDNNEPSILLLGRNNNDIEPFLESGMKFTNKSKGELSCPNYPNIKLKFKTAHSSKGLEDDIVIIINADDKKLGFPNKIEDDELLNLVLSSKDEYEYSEERRLWYVALTRTRTYTYIITSPNNTSSFVKEIINQCEIMNNDITQNQGKVITCPKCKTGKLIQRQNSKSDKCFYGCSNYPYCDYTNDDLKAVEYGYRCPDCGDFLTVKNGKYGQFWGCTSFKKTGCNFKEKYYPKEK